MKGFPSEKGGYTPPEAKQQKPLKINGWKLEDDIFFWMMRFRIFSGALSGYIGLQGV